MAVITIKSEDASQEFMVTNGITLSEALGFAEHPVDMPCGGKGICGNCKVKAWGSLSAMGNAERTLLSQEEINAGVRLSCMTKLEGDAVVERKADSLMNIAVSGKTNIDEKLPLYKKWGVAVDLGTTTLAAQLYNNDGITQTASAKNPQSIYGADVISRIDQAIKGKQQELKNIVISKIKELIGRMANDCGISPCDIDYAIITGNTAMLYLLTGKKPDSLSHAPFLADCLFGFEQTQQQLPLGIKEDAKVYLPKCMSAFVGADITTAVLASQLTKSPKTTLLVDIGTNGEMALWHEGKLYCCSTAAGPAFEGAGIRYGVHAVPGAIDKVWIENNNVLFTTIGEKKPIGICGSGIIDAISVLFSIGVIDETGAMLATGHGFEESIKEQDGNLSFFLCEDVAVTEKDVRMVQMAKAAIKAGIETIIGNRNLHTSQIEKLYIAGGFGQYLDIKSAAIIGLIPVDMADKVEILGNASISGAAILLQNKNYIDEATGLAEASDTVDLTTNPEFLDNYVQGMMFGE